MEALELLKKHDIAITDLRVELLQILSLAKTPLSYDHLISKPIKPVFIVIWNFLKKRVLLVKVS